MSNAIFPSLPGLSYPVEKTPKWSTKVQRSVSGKETRLGYWSYPVWEWSLNYDILRSDDLNAELQELIGFFNSRQGSFDSWLFNDPDDNAADSQAFAIGDGSTKAFQLSRTYGGYNEPVKAINAISQITVNGSPTSAYAANISTGVITFVSAPASGALLRWSGTYYWRCRFSEDETTVAKFMNNFWENRQIRFVSVK